MVAGETGELFLVIFLVVLSISLIALVQRWTAE